MTIKFNGGFGPITGAIKAGDAIPPVITYGLHLHYDINSYPGSGTTITDLSGNGSGTLVGGVGTDSNSYIFDGNNDYITVPAINRITSTTIEVWFNTTTVVPNRQYLYTQQQNPPSTSTYTYEQSQNIKLVHDTIEFQYNTTNNDANAITSSAPTFSTNEWVQIVATLSSNGDKQLYKNGQAVSGVVTGSGSITPHSNFAVNQGVIGARNDSNSIDRFSGNIGIVREYNRGLSSEEVLQNFNHNRSAYNI